MKKLYAFLIVLSAIAIPAAHATVYSYSDGPLTYANATARIDIQFWTAANLPPNLGLFNLLQYDGLDALTINNGVPTDSILNDPAWTFTKFLIGTDSNGNINSWDIDATVVIPGSTPTFGATEEYVTSAIIVNGVVYAYDSVIERLTPSEFVNLDLTGPSGSWAVSPEPSTFALFGTGTLGLMGVLRRRLRRT